jgi:N-acetylglucosamine-6-phosphate deacetylase
VLQQNYLPDFLEAAPGGGSFQKIGCAIVFAQALKGNCCSKIKGSLNCLGGECVSQVEAFWELPPVDLINVRLTGDADLQQIFIRDGLVQAIHSMQTIVRRSLPPNLQTIDLAGDWLSLGGVDLQINGALGLAFPDLELTDLDKLDEICQFLWQQGVDGFLPTVVTTATEKVWRSLQTIAMYRQSDLAKQPNRAEILGVHLEGPFLNAAKRGAHPEVYLQPLTVDQVTALLGEYAAQVRVMTLAPELDATGEAIAALSDRGITVSLGHSQATAEQARQAFERGATMVTHAFNAMPSLHHREPGLLATAMVYPGVSCGFIADGQHISPLMLDVLLRMNRGRKELASHLFLVSDALSPLGLPDGFYPWDSRQIEVRQGTARLPDGTLSGTTLSLLVGVQNLVRWQLVDVEEAIALATIAPREAIGLEAQVQVGTRLNHLLHWQVETATNELTWQRLTR